MMNKSVIKIEEGAAHYSFHIIFPWRAGDCDLMLNSVVDKEIA